MTVAWIPLAIPEISGAEAALRNRLYGASGQVRIDITGKPFRISFLPAFRVPYRPRLQMILTIGDRPAVLDMESIPLPELLGYPEGGLDPRDIPAEVLRAFLEGLLGDFRERAGSRLGRPIRLVEAGPSEGDASGSPESGVLHMEFDCADAPSGGMPQPLRARLHLADEDFAALVETLPAARSGAEDCGTLPLAIGFRIGSTSLTAGECAALGIGDILLLAGDPMAKGGIRLCAGDGNRPLWKATWYAGQVLLEEHCEREIPMENAGQGGEAARLDELEVQLSFDLGGRMATLAEVRALAAGSIFALPENPDARVCIRAGGKAIGTGSLIMVDGRAGVRVESLREGGQP